MKNTCKTSALMQARFEISTAGSRGIRKSKLFKLLTALGFDMMDDGDHKPSLPRWITEILEESFDIEKLRIPKGKKTQELYYIMK